jgi:DNA-binding GntR family transcriptional regulator
MSVKEELLSEVRALSDQDAEQVLLMVRRLKAIAAWNAAPPDDEEETEAERQAVAEARADIAAGKFVPWEQVKRRWHELDH